MIPEAYEGRVRVMEVEVDEGDVMLERMREKMGLRDWRKSVLMFV